TGDAMGMNMVSKGVQNVLDFLQIDFPDMDVIGISGRVCIVVVHIDHGVHHGLRSAKAIPQHKNDNTTNKVYI
ncbi:3-hydroxy-3-methylglutaryl-coenzyme A reductase 1-like protein, partial [Tanacetum coccineum]